MMKAEGLFKPERGCHLSAPPPWLKRHRQIARITTCLHEAEAMVSPDIQSAVVQASQAHSPCAALHDKRLQVRRDAA